MAQNTLWTLTCCQIGKLNIYRTADREELLSLHPADRLMVRLIEINRLGPRIESMLYKLHFEESWSLCHTVCLIRSNIFQQLFMCNLFSLEC